VTGGGPTGVCGTHALTALTRLPLGPLFACSASRGLVEGLMKEAEEVGRALGVAVPRGSAAEAFRDYERRAVANPGVYAAIYYDVVNGCRLELPDMNGAVVRLGREVGVPTPLNFAIYASLAPYLATRRHGGQARCDATHHRCASFGGGARLGVRAPRSTSNSTESPFSEKSRT
jgi:2-dehydropantoate 2-reductase